jgi:Ca-activated chloride channel homolog
VSFQRPIALIALLVVPLIVAFYYVRARRQLQFASRWGSPALLPNVVDRAPGKLRYLPLAILLVALAAMIVGVARPHAVVSVPREEATVVLAIDVSRSMKADDVEPTRLEAAKTAAKAFLEKVPKKFRVGVVSFASRANAALPPTEDRALARSALDSLKPGEGTAIGDAIALSGESDPVALLADLARDQLTEDGKRPPKAVLLISDGAPDGGSTPPREAARKAKSLGVPVYTVLVGTEQGVVEEELPGGLRARIQVPPDPDVLKQVAEVSGGEFFTASDDDGLKKVYEDLGSRLGHRDKSREVTDAFAGGSAALLLTGGLLSVLWFRRVP